MGKYAKLDTFMFYYYIGLAYYDKDKVDISIKWYKKAELLNSNNFELMNSLGIAYDEIKRYD
jgi:tetratricopeptide (TPR) repeat protein